jgi:hypothetical protein
VNFFMNKFRKLRFIDYDADGVMVHPSLVSVVLQNEARDADARGFLPLVAVTFKFFDALRRPRAERGRVAGNRDFPRALNLPHPPIERGNELAQLTEHRRRCYGQRRAPRRPAAVRDTFQTSPQPVHRQ